jgi:hypothetical protein
MVRNREFELSPADLLADSEFAITDRTPDPLGPRLEADERPVVGERDERATTLPRSDVPMSARAFQRWLIDTARPLSDRRVAGVFARGLRTSRDTAPTWISLTSSWAYGRIIRNGDGSSDSSAYRVSDGRTLILEHHATTTPAHLDDLLQALTPPPRAHVRSDRPRRPQI